MGLVTCDGGDVRQIRQDHLEQEANLRSLEIIYYVLAAVLVVLSAMFVRRMFYIGFFDAGLAIFACGLLLIAVFLFWIGRQFRYLTFTAAVIGSLVAVVGLLAIPFGTLLGTLTLYSIWCKKGRYIFTPEYRRVIAETPDIRCRTGGVILAFFLLMVVLTTLVLLAVIFKFHPGHV